MDAMKLEIQTDKYAAKQFVASKGRMPKNREELVEWLLEFDALAFGMLNSMQETFLAHLQYCTNPIVPQPKIEVPPSASFGRPTGKLGETGEG